MIQTKNNRHDDRALISQLFHRHQLHRISGTSVEIKNGLAPIVPDEIQPRSNAIYFYAHAPNPWRVAKIDRDSRQMHTERLSVRFVERSTFQG